ncbi:AAA ATPase domain-containing protein [Rhodococcus rhodochrous J3]|uniref:LuxR C-terminal-related transcriptional regulator n=2 Tax=Rhodococcus rhodochrous TaxID=1829 RepID=A0AA46X134_RHORH|nr:LuxR C-terminal-related transcriptional regulator [Rhodococcus rhodochrous]MBF4479173.1 helix-turn-helix transcriptional regulator [Rhodococcus rhodochrous]MCB8913209.1 LuxR C-terminal-related transcriptional regulator [Rhodococcus rhodochrous]TWH55814.1 Response regulator containing a CheY-like receiver domain and an HTH DNA-binding domain [Rhodococcus rhodochrous J38]UZF47414.1 LuxR C-terminal-related transcriptional regulator [Rhodococcus rhodochrous]SMG13050.1 AAA ATPase domain-containi
MDQRWPLIQRRGELGIIVAALTDPDRGGVVLTGDPGVGKTTLARMATDSLSAPVRWIAGTESARSIPLGAFAHLIEAPPASDPVAFLAAARQALLGEHGSDRARLVLGVDDAHLLDPLSATFLHQLALDHAVHTVATVRNGEVVPDAVTSLWKDGHLIRLELSPFTRQQCIDLIETVLGGPLEELSADLIWKASGGNALFVHHLVVGTREAGTLRRVGNVWQLRGGTAVTSELASLLEHRIDHLTPEVLQALQLLAFCEPLDLEILCGLAGDDAVEEAERRGLIDVVDDNRNYRVRYTHPLFGEVVRRRVGRVAGRRIRGQLVEALGSRVQRGPADRIRLAELSLDSSRSVDPELLETAAHDAIALGDAPLAERFARAAFDATGTFSAADLLARALVWLGGISEVESVLASFDPRTLDESELVRWGATRISNLFWGMGNAAEAQQVLATLRELVTRPHLGSVVDAIDCGCAVYEGRPRDALTLAHRVLATETALPWAVEWAFFGGGLALAVMGRGHEVPAMAARCAAVADQVDGLLRYPAGLGEVLALLLTGSLDEAERRAETYRESAVRGPADAHGTVTSIGQYLAWGLANILLGVVDTARGRFVHAVHRLEQAVAALQVDDRAATVSWNVPAYLALTHGYAVLGRVNDADAALAQATSRSGRHVAVFEPQLRIAEAWLAVARGETTNAITSAREAAQISARHDQFAVEAIALHTATRFGDRTTAERLSALTEQCDGRLVAAMAAHATASAEADGRGLTAAAETFEALGALADAADAHALAAIAYRDHGDTRRSVEAAAAAAALAARCDHASSPALDEAARPLPLTSREREIAAMVTAGLSNRQIADRLVVSVRTVEGHIYRACTKLDVSDRTELAELMRDTGRR